MTVQPPLLLNSITDADDSAQGRVVICGSHGGLYPAYLASGVGLRAVIFNDAGKGLEDAGVAGVMALADAGSAAAAVSHNSSRIADAEDMLARGRISVVNALARQLGVEIGATARQAAPRLAANDRPTSKLATVAEARRVLRIDGILRDIVLADSASLVTPKDKDCIVITGSHGGLIGGDPARALKATAVFAVFNDAGGGCDDAGISRLPALAERGIAAVTVAHSSARIGDAQSALHTGVVSAVNTIAADMKIKCGDPLNTVLTTRQF